MIRPGEDGYSEITDALHALEAAVRTGDTIESKILLAIAYEPELINCGPVVIAKRLKLDIGECIRLFRTADFRRSLERCFSDALGGPAEIIAAIRKNMHAPGPEGASDRRLAAQISGLLWTSSEVRHSGNVEVSVNLAPDSEILWLYQHLAVPPENWRPHILDSFKKKLLQPKIPGRFALVEPAEPSL